MSIERRERPIRDAHTKILAYKGDTSGREARYLQAMCLALNGWPVLPLNGKIPVSRCAPKGVYSATTDHEIINGWNLQESVYNIGIAVPRGLVVLDIDPRNGGSLKALHAVTGDLPPTVTVKTGGNGWHLYYRLPEGMDKLTPKSSLSARGIDVKGVGGYVVAPPSIHPDTGQPYRWHTTGTIAQLPQNAIRALSRVDPPPRPHKPVTGKTRPRWEGIINHYVAHACEGERNKRLSGIAWIFCKENQPPEAFNALVDAGVTVGLTRTEAQRTIASAKRGYGRRNVA